MRGIQEYNIDTIIKLKENFKEELFLITKNDYSKIEQRINNFFEN